MNQIIDSVPVWLSLIAINMTVIGLTSLADRKTIIGVDYSKYLLKNYKIAGVVRIFSLLIVFAMINILSLFVMLSNIYYLKIVFFLMLCASLVFAIFYFFGFILIENKQVRREICYNEILGLYFYKRNTGDIRDRVHKGMPAKKSWKQSLSTNVISYFNEYNPDTIADFAQVFGPNSILYPQTHPDRDKIERYYEKHYLLQVDGETDETERPCDYTVNFDGIDGKYVSMEFLDLIRGSKIPDRWVGEAFRLFSEANKEIGHNVNALNFAIVMHCLAMEMFYMLPYLAQTHFIKMLYSQMIVSYPDSKLGQYETIQNFLIFLLHSLQENQDASFRRFGEDCMIHFIKKDKPDCYDSVDALREVVYIQLDYGNEISLRSVYKVVYEILGEKPVEQLLNINVDQNKSFISGYNSYCTNHEFR